MRACATKSRIRADLCLSPAASRHPLPAGKGPREDRFPFCEERLCKPRSAVIDHRYKSREWKSEGVQATACFASVLPVPYVAMTAINTRLLDRELKKGSAELIILSIVEPRPRHGYEISKLIEARSGGKLKFHVASLYPLLYRLEERGWLQGRWVEKAGQRRRRFYSLTAEGRRVLDRQRDTWKAFVRAMGLVTGIRHA